MAQRASKLEEALALALSLSPKDRLRLVEYLVFSVEKELQPPSGEPAVPEAEGHWGTGVVALLDELDTSEWEQMDVPDVGEWVREQRQKQSDRYAKNWECDE